MFVSGEEEGGERGKGKEKGELMRGDTKQLCKDYQQKSNNIVKSTEESRIGE